MDKGMGDVLGDEVALYQQAVLSGPALLDCSEKSPPQAISTLSHTHFLIGLEHCGGVDCLQSTLWWGALWGAQ